MGKNKKRSEEGEGGGSSGHTKAGSEASTSALIICRNKHWRYISSFHGPWLQLPPEVLESLAHSNWLAPRPRPIDAAVLFDLVKIRRHVDEATTLAVRAASGLTSAALNTSAHGHGALGPAAALGLGLGLGHGGGGGGGGGTLSRERKHRMRELATGKLSAAYRLDEIAASVATMQSASTLEDVAALVLQRSPDDADARYVHFFHEKIPSRMMAQCTPLDALDAVVADRPGDASALRTRALTRIFKHDYAACARDLTAALAAARRPGARSLAAVTAPHPRSDAPPAADEQPSSLEPQLLFHRAGVYLTLACTHVAAALDGLQQQEAAQAARAAADAPTPETPPEAAARLARAEHRRLLRQHAKRALRDYTAFLARFDYTPGLSPEAAHDFVRRFAHGNGSNGSNGSNDTHDYDARLDRLLQESAPDALAPYRRPPADRPWPRLPPPPVFTLNQLFDALPPAALPPYPPHPHTPPSPLPSNESLTYHPLLADALHSLLLVHALLQTPPKELLRHAHNAARLARLLDGYPIFLAARSPARSDWVEVLRRGGNWIGLQRPWESLCRASTPSGPNTNGANGTVARAGASHSSPARSETPTQRRERQKHEAILEALADERVVDEESFQRAVRAREKRFHDDDKAEAAAAAAAASSLCAPANANTTPDTNPTPPKRWAPQDTRDYPISTERAEAISRWVRDAPALTSDPSAGTRKKKRRKTPASSKASSSGLEASVQSLSLSVQELA